MPASFHRRAGPFALKELAALAGAVLARAEDGKKMIQDIAPLSTAGPEDLTFLSGGRYREAFTRTRAGACLTEENCREPGPQGTSLLRCADPAAAYARVAKAFYPDAARPQGVWQASGVAPGAHIHPSARLEEGVAVEPGAVVGPRAGIGAGTIIAAQAVIGPDVKIGRECVIGPHVAIIHSLLGDRVFVHGGAQLGHDGFGYFTEAGAIAKVPQTGRLIVQNDVEIGANTAIDRGTNQDTIIGEGSKIDNLVQIGHNVRIGRNCFLAAHVGISGSCVIGDGAALGGKAGVIGHVHIGAGAQVAARSGVTKDLPPGGVYGGFPAMPVKVWKEKEAALRHLAKARRQGAKGK